MRNIKSIEYLKRLICTYLITQYLIVASSHQTPPPTTSMPHKNPNATQTNQLMMIGLEESTTTTKPLYSTPLISASVDLRNIILGQLIGRGGSNFRPNLQSLSKRSETSVDHRDREAMSNNNKPNMIMAEFIKSPETNNNSSSWSPIKQQPTGPDLKLPQMSPIGSDSVRNQGLSEKSNEIIDGFQYMTKETNKSFKGRDSGVNSSFQPIDYKRLSMKDLVSSGAWQSPSVFQSSTVGYYPTGMLHQQAHEQNMMSSTNALEPTTQITSDLYGTSSSAGFYQPSTINQQPDIPESVSYESAYFTGSSSGSTGQDTSNSNANSIGASASLFPTQPAFYTEKDLKSILTEVVDMELKKAHDKTTTVQNQNQPGAFEPGTTESKPNYSRFPNYLPGQYNNNNNNNYATNQTTTDAQLMNNKNNFPLGSYPMGPSGAGPGQATTGLQAGIVQPGLNLANRPLTASGYPGPGQGEAATDPNRYPSHYAGDPSRPQLSEMNQFAMAPYGPPPKGAKRKHKRGSERKKGRPQMYINPKQSAPGAGFYDINSGHDLQPAQTFHKYRRPYNEDDEEEQEGETEFNVRFFNNFSRLGPMSRLARYGGGFALFVSLAFLVLSNVSLAATLIAHGVDSFLRNPAQCHEGVAGPSRPPIRPLSRFLRKEHANSTASSIKTSSDSGKRRNSKLTTLTPVGRSLEKTHQNLHNHSYWLHH